MRPERLKGLPEELEWHPRELFLSTARHKKEMWSGTVEIVPVTITELRDVSTFPELPPPHTFFYQPGREYDGKNIIITEECVQAGELACSVMSVHPHRLS